MHFQDDHARRDSHHHHQIMNGALNSALRINRGSHFIKKYPSSPSTSSSSSSSSASTSSVLNGVAAAIATAMPQPRHPVIIYTHSPKVIHTQPKDFMALVQKLTGFSRPAMDDGRSSPPSPPPPQPKPEPSDEYIITEIANNNILRSSNHHEITDNDSTSVVTDEKEGSCSVGHGFDPQNNSFDNNEYLNNNNNNNGMQYFHPTSMDFLCSGPPFGNCVDSLLLMRSSISSSSSSLESVKDLPDF